MNLIGLAEAGVLPERLVRLGIRRLLRRRLRDEPRGGDAPRRTAELAQSLRAGPIALAAEQANAQHYDVPPAFFEAVLGPRLKYSCGLYRDAGTTLAEAEEAMLRLTCLRADLVDGMDVLDLGCGWGAFSLWVAEHFPHCRVTALSNSAGQRRYIEALACERGLGNLHVITANLADYAGGPRPCFDRVVSVEMFEHMRNYEVLLGRIAGWLRPAGKLFVHIFCHRAWAYPFEDRERNDWMARHFFTGGLMPSYDLLGHFDRDLAIARRWRVDGRHYARTCDDWLRNLDANRARLLALFAAQGDAHSARLALERWRIFFMACAELFGYAGGSEWFVGHYLLEPTPRPAPVRATVSEPESAPRQGRPA